MLELFETIKARNGLPTDDLFAKLMSKRESEPEELPVMHGLKGIFKYGMLEDHVWKNAIEEGADLNAPEMYEADGFYIHPSYGYAMAFTDNASDFGNEFTYYVVGCLLTATDWDLKAGVLLSTWYDNGLRVTGGYLRYYYPETIVVQSTAMNEPGINTGLSYTTPGVIAVTGKNGVCSVYLNGTLVGTGQLQQCSPIHSVMIGSQYVSEQPGYATKFKFVAIGNELHTADEVAANSARLVSEYGIGGGTSA